MAIRKVCGIETEYGIVVRGARLEPVAASSVLINAYVRQLDRARSVWDFEDESPGNDARGFALEGALPPDVETHLVNAVLTNGARYYVDHAHPEISTPGVRRRPARSWCSTGPPRRSLKRRWWPPAASLPDGAEIIVYKNNSDGKGNSYGCHENYLLARRAALRPHRRPDHAPLRHPPGLLRGGQGGQSSHPASRAPRCPFQLSQRADFFEEEVGLETTLKRPIVNTRDEPHCDGQQLPPLPRDRGRRQPQRGGDVPEGGHARRSCLAMIEDDQLADRPGPARSPVGAIRQVSHDPTLTRTVLLKSGRRLDRARRPVAAARAGPEVRARAGPGERRRRGRRARCCDAGKRCSPGSRPTGQRWPPWSTGWPRSGCSRPIASATAWSGATPGCGPWTSSTTTCATSARCSTGWASSGSAPTRRSSGP